MAKHYNKFIKLFLPKIVFDHLHYKLWVNEPNFAYDIEIFYSLVNDLSNIKYYNDFEEKNGMIPMYSKLLQKKYGNSYNQYIHYLTVNSIIYSSIYYSEDNCYHYSLVTNNNILDMLDREYYNTTYCLNTYNNNAIQVIDINEVIRGRKTVKNLDVVVVKVSILKRVGKYVITQHNKERDRIKHYPPHIKAMAQYFKSTLAIAYDAAINHTVKLYHSDIKEAGENLKLRETAFNKYNHRIKSIITISEGKKELRFKRNKSNRRIDTNLTNLSKDLRQFLNGFDTSSYLDLSNSQPVLFNIILNQYYNTKNQKLKAEIELYRKHTLNGNWYEFLMKIYKVNREAAKTKWMEIAYSRNSSLKREKKKFANTFPQIMTIIESKKENDHAKFAVELQKIESKIFIDEICKVLVESDIMPYTLHDGLVVPKEKETQTYDIMASVLKKYLGSIPVISINETKVYPKKIEL